MDGQDKTEMGRPTLYKPEYADQAHSYCLLGATNDELAGFFNVAPRTVDNWLSVHADFATAVRNGRAAADASIARKLYRRADGYDYTAEKLVVYRGEAKKVDLRVHVPPDVGACIFWLRNRRREQWSEGARPAAADNGLNFDELEEASRRVAERNANAQ